jgi:hypothetical protein
MGCLFTLMQSLLNEVDKLDMEDNHKRLALHMAEIENN